MLVNKNLNDKTYQELISEAIMQIPLYTTEWTNFNPSDPGMTILENLTAFEALQQETIRQVTPQIRQKLLKMLGFTERKGRCARILMAAEGVKEPVELPANQPFYLGDLTFETNRRIRLSGYSLTGVYGQHDGGFQDYSYLIDDDIPKTAMIFGEKPGEGDCVYFAANRLPEPGEEMIFYMTLANRFNRNPYEEKGNNTFANLVWECYTEKGYEPMNVADYTSCFLVSGEVRMRMPNTAAAVCEELPKPGYAIRARVVKADYDVSPKLRAVAGFLFEAWQKETKSVCYTFQKYSRITLNSEMMEEGYLQVFCKEEKGSFYRRYEPAPGEGARGRFYTMEHEQYGVNTFSFDRRQFGFSPDKLKNAVKIMVYSEEMMRRFYLGTVQGYDAQELELPAKNIVAESFCIIAKRTDENGEDIFDFVRPNHYEEDSLTYYLLENEGKIVIEDAGAFIGAALYMGSCSVTRGQEGNIREGSRFRTGKTLQELTFVNAGPGTGGCFRESIADVRERFLADMNKPYTAVTAADYETIVKSAPGLCIHKVRAVLREERNEVQIAVKPGTDERFPKLSDTYRKSLEQLLEKKRLLTTRVEIVQPVYLPINVKGVIYVKRHYEREQGLIEKTIREQLDYLESERSFGDVLKFDEVFRAVENLECVEYIYDLALYPQYPGAARIKDNDIYPNADCLCYAGDIQLEIRNYEK